MQARSFGGHRGGIEPEFWGHRQMLSDTACRKAIARSEPYRLADSSGLYLYVTVSGHRSWRLGYRFAGVKKRVVLGSYPEMTLVEAREARDEARRLVVKGIDPAIEKKQRAAARKLDSAATFRAIGDEWLAEQRPRWSGKHAQDVQRALERDLYPSLGHIPVSQITKVMVVQRLKAIEKSGSIETAKRHRQRIEAIFAYAQALGHDIANPADVGRSLRPLIKGKRPALTDLQAARRLLLEVEALPAHPVTKLASRFIALTSVRPGVAQLLPWAELPADGAEDPEWVIPAARMKLSVERKQMHAFDHVVPLARQTMELIKTLRLLTGQTPYAFPSTISTRRPISDSTISKLYRDAGYAGRHVPHGWRSSFSTIMNERAMAAGAPGDKIVIDLMLAHVQEGVEPIYNRAAYMARRRELAQEWADLLLDGLPAPADLLALPRR